ncbi:MAG: gamma-glutamyl-gamma-aminobutyrate hydrolase family protein [Actinomycetota bacterium]|nr:gamma-glutamyl-gamma-aminobutyrate hydrolase family protein [Actinomycetota bacterium]
MTRRIVAVVGERVAPGHVEGWKQGGVAVPERYLHALHRAGGLEAVLMPERVPPDEAEARLAPFDALMLIGGGDLHPSAYGQDPVPQCYGMDEEADAFEMEMAGAAVRLGKPLLAICRGMQVLNVALGGTLHQHISGREGVRDHGTPRRGPAMHPVGLEEASRVAEALGTNRPDCQSSHHQAVDRLGEGLRAVGRTDDRVIEAIEHQHGWIVGVQWHPERTAEDDPAQQRLFDTLVERAGT